MKLVSIVALVVAALAVAACGGDDEEPTAGATGATGATGAAAAPESVAQASEALEQAGYKVEPESKDSLQIAEPATEGINVMPKQESPTGTDPIVGVLEFPSDTDAQTYADDLEEDVPRQVVGALVFTGENVYSDQQDVDDVVSAASQG
jgi:hypothetical protein